MTVRIAAANETLRARDAGAREVAERWEQFVDYVALGLGQDLGRDVRPGRPRKQTSAGRLEANCAALAAGSVLGGGDSGSRRDRSSRRPGGSPHQKVITSVVVDAPGEGRSATRVNWLLRQLKDAPDALLIEASFVNSKATSASLLSAARESPQALLLAHDPKRPPRAFRLALSRSMGTKRGKGERSFVLETRKLAIDFYREPSFRTCGRGNHPRRSCPTRRSRSRWRLSPIRRRSRRSIAESDRGSSARRSHRVGAGNVGGRRRTRARLRGQRTRTERLAGLAVRLPAPSRARTSTV